MPDPFILSSQQNGHFCSYFTMKKLRLREIEKLAPGHQRRTCDWNTEGSPSFWASTKFLLVLRILCDAPGRRVGSGPVPWCLEVRQVSSSPRRATRSPRAGA